MYELCVLVFCALIAHFTYAVISRAPKISPFGFSEATVGGEIKVVCVSSGAVSLTWSKNGEQLFDGVDNIGIKQVEDMLILEIRKVEPKHSGNYTCTARNQDNASGSFSAFLAVPSPPKWITTPQDIVASTKMSITELLCDASGYPEPNITWYKNGEVLQSGRAFQLRSDSSSTEGFFMCRAVNEYGNIQYKFKVSVTCYPAPNVFWYKNAANGSHTKNQSNETDFNA